jgi:hypothetical protein
MGASMQACACACDRVALLIQHANRMRPIILSVVAPLAPPHFSTLSHKRHDFRKRNVIEHKMCVPIFSEILTKIFLILRRIQRDIFINVKTSSPEVPVLIKLEFSRWIFEKKLKY